MSLLQIQALELERAGLSLFKPVELDVRSGALIAIEADNGVGKTSLLRALAGLLPIAAGSVRRRTTPQPLAIRFMAHQLAVKGLLDVQENLRFWSVLDGNPAVDSQISAALEAYGLAGFEWQLGQTLSAGQRKRVALCRLALSPGELWLLDEPFANLDRHGIAMVGAAISAQRERGGAVLITTHGSTPLEMTIERLRLEPRL